MKIFPILFLFISIKAYSQPLCNGLGATAQSAISVCGTNIFTQVSLPPCTGVQLPLIAGLQCPGDNNLNTDNSTWFKINVYQSGTLGFIISPSLPSDDYDWVLFDVTNRNLQDVYSTNLVVAYNQCSTTGNTGCSPAGFNTFNCRLTQSLPTVSNFNSMYPVSAGSTYLLMIISSPFSGPTYNLNITGGTAVVTNNLPPTITSITSVGCNTTQLKVTFSEDILCSSLNAFGSQFSIPGASITSIISQCTAGTNAVSSIILNFASPLPTNVYTLTVNSGIKDVCDTDLLPTTIGFGVTAQTVPFVNQVIQNSCTPNILKVALSKKVLCSSITASGSEFSVSPGVNTISSISTMCTGTPALTDTVIINLAAPLTQGNYTLNINNGTAPDNNTLLDTCGLLTPNGYAFNFNVPVSPAAPLVTPTVTYCINATATPLTATGTNLLWYTTATLGTGSTTAPTPSTTSGGTTNYYVSQSTAPSGGCESPRSLIAVTVLASIPAPTVVTPINRCQFTTPAAITATGTNLLWYPTLVGGTGTSTAPIVPTATAGSILYYVSQTISGCESPRVQMVVNINTTPLSPTFTSPISRCQGSTPVPLAATGTNLLWYTTLTGGSSTTIAPSPPTTTLGSYIYYVTQTVGGCESARDDIIVNIDAVPAAPIVISNALSYCQNAAALPLSSNVTGSNLIWYTVPAGGTYTSIVPVPLTSSVGTTTYYVAQLNGGCPGPRVGINVTITVSPSAITATSPINVCQFATAPVLSATPTAGNTIIWYNTLTGGVGSNTAPVINTNTSGSTTYYVTQTNGSCEASPRAAIVVNITAAPASPNATTPINYCTGNTATALSATGTGLLWYTTATGSTGSPTPPIPNTSVAGTTNYYVSQTVSGCESQRATITVVVSQTPPAVTGTTSYQFCQATAGVFTLTQVTGTNVLWYLVPNGGVGNPAPPSLSQTSAGVFTFYATQTIGTCESVRTPVVVTIDPTPAAPTVSTPINYCVGNVATPLTATGTNIKWYTVSNGGVALATAPTPNTSSISTVTYYASQTVGNCEGPRAAVVVDVALTPSAPIVNSNVSLCQFVNATPLNATGTNLIWYPSFSGSVGSSTAPIPSTATVGSTIYYVSQSGPGGTCESPRASITVNILPSPAAPFATTPYTYCVGATTTQLTATGVNLKWYTTSSGGIGSTLAPTPSSAVSGTTTYYVTQTQATCESQRTSVVVNVLDYPAAPTVISPLQLCPNSTALPLVAVGNNLLWYTLPFGGVASSTAPIPSTATLGSTTYYVSASNGNCEGPRRALTVIIANPLSVSIGLDTTICEGKSVTFSPTVSPAGLTYQWRALGTIPQSTIANATSLNATVSPINDAMYVLKASISTCEREDTVNVFVRWKPIVNAGADKPICLGDSVLLVGNVSHTTGPIASFDWTSIDSLRTPSNIQTWSYPKVSTLYTLSVKTDSLVYGCNFTSTDDVRVIIQPSINAFAGRDTIAVKGKPHQLYGSGGNNYVWSSPTASILSPFVQNPKAILNDDAVFYLKVTDGVGCAGYDTVFVKVYDGPTYYIPNSFTPNGDGINDVFRAIPVGMANTIYFRVFNRYGELVFETNQYLKGWDGTYKGKDQPNGVYVWMISGTDRNFVKVNEQGTVNLIR